MVACAPDWRCASCFAKSSYGSLAPLISIVCRAMAARVFSR